MTEQSNGVNPLELKLAGALTRATQAKKTADIAADHPEMDGHLARETSHQNAIVELITILANEKGVVVAMDRVLTRRGEIVSCSNEKK